MPRGTDDGRACRLIAKATLVQAYFVYECDHRYTVDATLAHRDRFASIVVLDPLDRNSPDELSRLVEKQSVAGLRWELARRYQLPLGTFLGMGAIFVVFYGAPVLEWYARLFE